MGPKKKDKKAKAEEAAVEESGLYSDEESKLTLILFFYF